MPARLHHTFTFGLTLALAACGSDVGNDLPHGGTAGNNSVTGGGGSSGAAGSGGSIAGGDASTDRAAKDAGVDATAETSIDDFGAEAGARVAELLGAQSPDCLACAQASCGNYVTGCATLSGTAKNGPAAGERKAALCIETLDCVIPNGCARLSTAACYCGNQHPDPKFNCDLDSPCSRVLERSLESTDATDVLVAMSDATKGGGWAMSLMQCLRDNQCVACLPEPPDDGGTEGGSDGGADDEASTVGVATEKSLNRHTHPVSGSLKQHGNL
jgi:hypothetical protein